MSLPAPPIAVILIELAGIVLAARLFGLLFKRIGQPMVVGEIIAGILLGKTVLGHLGGDYTHILFPARAIPFLQVLAAVGLVLYMFVVGVEVDLDLIRGKGRVAASISVGSIVVPFAGGMMLAFWLHTAHSSQTRFLPFAMFIGAAMSITAFPVLARILTERGMHRTELGGMALASAAVDDILAWSLLAGVIIVAGSGDSQQWHLLLGLPYLAVMFWVVRPLLRLLVPSFARAGALEPNLLAVVLVGVFASAWVTDWLGLHYIFGAFLFGSLMPRAEAQAMLQQIVSRLEQVSMLLLLPVFFIITGLGVDIGSLGAKEILELVVILAVAIGGKFIGAFVGASLQRVRPRRAAAVAVLMNTRGLTELVILAVGRDKGILDEGLYTLLVIMAIATTVMTGPLLHRVYPDRWVQLDVADAERQALGTPDAYRVVVAIDVPEEAGPLVDLAAQLIGAERPAELVLTTVRPHSAERMEVGSGLRSELLEVASSAAALHALSSQVADIPCTVLTRLGDDVVGELCAQLIAVDADVVVLGGNGSVGTGVLQAALPQVILAVGIGDTGQDVVCRLHGGPDGDAAVETALRLTVSRRRPLVLVESHGRSHRRGSGLADQLGRAGKEVVVEPSTATRTGAHTVCVPAGVPTVLPPVLIVRAQLDRRPTDWERIMQRITPSQARQA